MMAQGRPLASRAAPAQPEVRRVVRQVLRGARQGTLATAMAGAHGWPYASLVSVGWAHDLAPLFLLSHLAQHTRNFQADPRVCLLIEAGTGKTNPQEETRVSLLGTLRASATPEHRARFLARHPDARQYADFSDFQIYRLTVETAHLVSGFGRALWLTWHGLAPRESDAKAIAAAEADLLDQARPEMLAARAGRRDKGWKVSGLDMDGADLSRGGRWLRLSFPEPCSTPVALAQELTREA